MFQGRRALLCPHPPLPESRPGGQGRAEKLPAGSTQRGHLLCHVVTPSVAHMSASMCALPVRCRGKAALRGSRDNSPPFTTGQMQVEGSHRLPKVTQCLSSRAGRQHPTPVSGQCSLVSLLEAPLPPRPQSHLDMPSQTPALPATLLPAQCGRCPLRWARQPPRAAFRGLGGGAWPGSGAWRCSTSRRGHRRRGAGPFTPPAALRVRARSAGPP